MFPGLERRSQLQLGDIRPMSLSHAGAQAGVHLPGLNISPRHFTAIQEYNDAVMDDVPFNPNVKDGRGTVGLDVPKSNWANRLDAAPFEAYAITCGITFTFGGVRIDTDGAVQDRDGRPIPGLFSAGEMVGGLFYFNYPGGTGLMAGAVFGRIAGESAGRASRRNN